MPNRYAKQQEVFPKLRSGLVGNFGVQDRMTPIHVCCQAAKLGNFAWFDTEKLSVIQDKRKLLFFLELLMSFIDRVALAKQGDNGIGSVRPSVRLFVYLFICLFVCLSVCALSVEPFDL